MNRGTFVTKLKKYINEGYVFFNITLIDGKEIVIGLEDLNSCYERHISFLDNNTRRVIKYTHIKEINI